MAAHPLRIPKLIAALSLALVTGGACAPAARVIEVSGSSMEPSYPDGTRMSVAQIEPDAVARGDLVMFKFPLDPERSFVKRLIGLPGETIELTPEGILIDGVALVEDYDVIPERFQDQVFRLAADEYFLLGDNRPESADSSEYGPIKWSDIIGKATPLD